MTNILKRFVDLIYGTQRVRRNFEINNPTEKVLAADASKSIITRLSQDVQHGTQWITSQRAVVLLTDKNIICGKWKINLDDISKINLLKISSIFGGGQILKVETKDEKQYQFGMQLNSEWINQTIIPLEYESGKIKYSTFSIIVRVIAIGMILFWLYDILKK